MLFETYREPWTRVNTQNAQEPREGLMYAAGLDRAVFPTRGAGSNLSPVAFPNCLIQEASECRSEPAVLV